MFRNLLKQDKQFDITKCITAEGGKLSFNALFKTIGPTLSNF